MSDRKFSWALVMATHYPPKQTECKFCADPAPLCQSAEGPACTRCGDLVAAQQAGGDQT